MKYDERSVRPDLTEQMNLLKKCGILSIQVDDEVSEM
jgi:hypothetical protein